MLHRAALGSFERFIGILIEHYSGAFPTWLSPVQVVVLNITDQHLAYSLKVRDYLRKLGFKAESDLRKEKITYKIRDHSIKRVPYLLVVGDKEIKNKTVSVRTRSNEDLGVMDIDKFVKYLSSDIEEKK